MKSQPDPDPFESLVVAAGETLRIEPPPLPDLLPQLKFVSDLLASAARAGLNTAGQASLVFRDRDPARTVRLQSIGETLRVGRGADCDLRFADLKEISRHHFTITHEAGCYRLTDPGSSNGTFLRGNPARIGTRTLLDGDIIEAGEFAFVFMGPQEKGDASVETWVPD